METVHKAGLIHRDISPDNLMIMKKSETIKLMDFGCAKEVDANYTVSVTLKQGYAPLEQYTGRNQGAWTDVYALCASIYYCVTGVKPQDSLMRAECDELIMPSKLAKVSKKQEATILKGLSVSVEHRFQSMEELYNSLYDDKKDENQNINTKNSILKLNEMIKRNESTMTNDYGEDKTISKEKVGEEKTVKIQKKNRNGYKRSKTKE